MYYEVIATGSTGNAVLINDVLFDCGIAYSKLKPYLYDVKYLILTHIHSDHIKESTLANIKKQFPKITIIGNYEVHLKYGVDVIANATFPVIFEDYQFIPFECEHDVLTYGYTFHFNDFHIIYATDTSTLENAPDEKYDFLFLESNHDESKINALLKYGNHKKFGYNAFHGAKRHLSTQSCKAFYYMHRKTRESQLIELHKSSRFY